jgi:hypothetical protein
VSAVTHLLAKSELRIIALLAVDECGAFVVEAVQPVRLLVHKVATESANALNCRAPFDF